MTTAVFLQAGVAPRYMASAALPRAVAGAGSRGFVAGSVRAAYAKARFRTGFKLTVLAEPARLAATSFRGNFTRTMAMAVDVAGSRGTRWSRERVHTVADTADTVSSVVALAIFPNGADLATTGDARPPRRAEADGGAGQLPTLAVTRANETLPACYRCRRRRRRTTRTLQQARRTGKPGFALAHAGRTVGFVFAVGHAEQLQLGVLALVAVVRRLAEALARAAQPAALAPAVTPAVRASQGRPGREEGRLIKLEEKE